MPHFLYIFTDYAYLLLFYSHSIIAYHFIKMGSINANQREVLFTSNGLLSDAVFVNPTISLKNIVTISKLSAVTRSPLFNTSATGLLKRENRKRNQNEKFD